MLPERPMKIEVVVDPSRLAPTPTLASRVAPAENTSPVTNGNGTQAARSVPVPFWFLYRITYRYDGPPSRNRGGAARGRGKRVGSRKTERPPKTAEDLDAEMEVGNKLVELVDPHSMCFFQDYTASNAAPAAAAAAA